MGDAQINRDAARFLFRQPIRVRACQSLDQRAFAVVHVAGSGDDEVLCRRHTVTRLNPRWFNLRKVTRTMNDDDFRREDAPFKELVTNSRGNKGGNQSIVKVWCHALATLPLMTRDRRLMPDSVRPRHKRVGHRRPDAKPTCQRWTGGGSSA